MAKKSRTAVLKRQREVRKAEKQAMKREKRVMRETDEGAEGAAAQQVATAADLEGYGFVSDEAVEEEEEPDSSG